MLFKGRSYLMTLYEGHTKPEGPCCKEKRTLGKYYLLNLSLKNQ